MFSDKRFNTVVEMISNNNRVLDLGCGDGRLLNYLKEKKEARVVGIEKEIHNVKKTIEKRIPVLHLDILDALSFYSDKSFDVVILNKTIQEIFKPNIVIKEMLRVGKKIIIDFLNYGFYVNRLYFLFNGQNPINEAIKEQWYETNRIRLLGIKDFEIFCQRQQIKIEKKVYLDKNWNKSTRLFPNFFAGHATYCLSKY